MTALLIATPNMKKVYQYENYFETTDIEQSPSKGWIASFDISNAEADLIDNGGVLLVENGKLIVIDEGLPKEIADVDEIAEEVT